MPKLTENLSLFKYDTQEDAEQTFNIDIAINENFDLIDEAIGELQNDMKGLTPFCVNSGSVDENGDSNIAFAPGIGKAWLPWEQPIATANATPVPISDGSTDNMVFSASRVQGGTNAFSAMDGSAGTSWGYDSTARPQWWQVKFPYTIKIFGLEHTNRGSNGSSSTAGRFYTASNKNTPIGDAISTPSTNGSVTAVKNIPTGGVITDTIYFEVTGGAQYGGIGRLKINAQWQVEVSTATKIYFRNDKSIVATTANGKTFTKNYIAPCDTVNLPDDNYTVTISEDSSEAKIIGKRLPNAYFDPKNADNDDYYLNISFDDGKLNYRIKQDGTFIDMDDVPIANFTKQNGTITKIENSLYNQNGHNVNTQTRNPNFCVVVEAWRDGTSWYRKYSDGRIEQGGRFTTSGSVTVNFSIAFSWECLGVLSSGGHPSSTGANFITSLSKTSCTIRNSTSNSQVNYWYAFGH